jgi:uncharacterized membrane protein
VLRGRRLVYALTALCLSLFYLAIEWLYIHRLPLGMDEFGGAYILRHLRTALPYRDFPPGKTVLAFYLELPAFLVTPDAWPAMLAVKVEVALIMAAALFVSALILSRHLPAVAVLGSLAMLVSMSTFLERSAELRVDPLAAVFGLASLLALIERRPALAGVFAACAFCCTQKGIYLVLAAQAALLADVARTRSRLAVRTWLRFTVASTAVLVAYLAFWSALASPHVVLEQTFFDKGMVQVARAAIYDIRGQYWLQTLLHNPFFYGLAFMGVLVLLRSWLRDDDSVTIVAPYAAALILLSLWHKQPWPYFFVTLIPTLYVVNAATLAKLLERVPSRRTVVVAVVAIVGIAFPLSRLAFTLERSNALQHATFAAVESLLAPGETYIDGMNMVYTHEQPAREIIWIDAARMRVMQTEGPAALLALIRKIDAGRPKLWIINYRTLATPPLVRAYLRSQFAPLWGNVDYYAPVVPPGRFELHFDGRYATERSVRIDGIDVAAGTPVPLRRGVHALMDTRPVRLHLQPPSDAVLDPRFAAGGDLFAGIFD